MTTILLVDDEDLLREGIKEILELKDLLDALAQQIFIVNKQNCRHSIFLLILWFISKKGAIMLLIFNF